MLKRVCLSPHTAFPLEGSSLQLALSSVLISQLADFHLDSDQAHANSYHSTSPLARIPQSLLITRDHLFADDFFPSCDTEDCDTEDCDTEDCDTEDCDTEDAKLVTQNLECCPTPTDEPLGVRLPVSLPSSSTWFAVTRTHSRRSLNLHSEAYCVSRRRLKG
jgi:hypothetical protein